MTYHSPATRHRLRVEAEQRASLEQYDTAGAGSEYELLLYQLKLDSHQLSGIQSQTAKAVMKVEMLPRYQPWLDGVLEAENPRPNDRIFNTCIIWHIDAGQLDRAAVLGLFAIRHGFDAPDQFKRTLPTIIYEEMAAAILCGQSISLGSVDAMNQQMEGAAPDMPDPSRSRWHKAAASVYEAAGKLLEALDQLNLAQKFDPDKAGVKTRIKQLEKQLDEILPPAGGDL